MRISQDSATRPDSPTSAPPGHWSGSAPLAESRVAVLMTIYNAGEYLAPALDSLLAQTYRDWTLVAVENGSSDGSKEVLQHYAQRDSRIRIIDLPANIGRTPALNVAFSASHSAYVAVLDADDLIHPERLSRQVAFLDANRDVSLLGTWVTFIDEFDAKIGEATPPTDSKTLLQMLGWTNPFAHSSVMFRRLEAAIVDGYPSQVEFNQDYSLWILLGRCSRTAILPEFLTTIRRLSSSLTRSAETQAIVYGDQARMLLHARRILPLDSESRRKNHQSFVEIAALYAIQLFKAGRHLMALKWLIHAFIDSPVVFLQRGLRLRTILFVLKKGTAR